MPKRELMQIRGITEAKVQKILEECRKLTGIRNFSTGIELLEETKVCQRFLLKKSFHDTFRRK